MSEAIKAAVELICYLKMVQGVTTFVGAANEPIERHKAVYLHPDSLEHLITALEALRPVASGKSVIVPVEPTEEMIEAGWIGKAQVGPEDIYRAMISASNT